MAEFKIGDIVVRTRKEDLQGPHYYGKIFKIKSLNNYSLQDEKGIGHNKTSVRLATRKEVEFYNDSKNNRSITDMPKPCKFDDGDIVVFTANNDTDFPPGSIYKVIPSPHGKNCDRHMYLKLSRNVPSSSCRKATKEEIAYYNSIGNGANINDMNVEKMEKGKYYSVDGGHIKMIGRVIEVGGKDSDGSYRGVADLISIENGHPKLMLDKGWSYKSSNRSYREATPFEINWLEYCIEKRGGVSEKEFKELRDKKKEGIHKVGHGGIVSSSGIVSSGLANNNSYSVRSYLTGADPFKEDPLQVLEKERQLYEEEMRKAVSHYYPHKSVFIEDPNVFQRQLGGIKDEFSQPEPIIIKSKKEKRKLISC